jgi:hypothetical protein
VHSACFGLRPQILPRSKPGIASIRSVALRSGRKRHVPALLSAETGGAPQEKCKSHPVYVSSISGSQ